MNPATTNPATSIPGRGMFETVQLNSNPTSAVRRSTRMHTTMAGET
jgi:hypothetical protein